VTREEAVREALARPWYHTIELGPGEVTPGTVDLRRVAPRVLPDSLAGERALDVGTFDGFWAFELAKRGAQVVATDVATFDAADWPPINREALAAEVEGTPGDRFPLAQAALGLDVTRVISKVSDLDADRIGGPVSFAVVGDLLIHLRDPVGGLERVRDALEPGGTLLLLEEINVPLTLVSPRRPAARFRSLSARFNWWQCNYSCLYSWLVAAGFETPERKVVYRLKAGTRGQRRWHAAFTARAPG
jgi:SAM-dependent methyltransferase